MQNNDLLPAFFYSSALKSQINSKQLDGHLILDYYYTNVSHAPII